MDELLAVGVSRVAERVAALGRRARTLLDGVAGWQVQEPVDAASGIVTLAHDSLDPLDTQAELFAAGITTSAIEAGRALELTRPVLRASFHAYCDDDDVEALARALRAIS